MKTAHLLFLSGITASLLVGAPADEFDLDRDFMESFDEISTLATKTKINIDDTASMTTILRFEELQGMGINTLEEALTLIPGIDTTMRASGVKMMTIRGAFEDSRVRLMVDGVGVNNFYRGSIYYLLNMPIEMIERIEVVRGLGSSLYGTNSYAGIINVVTHLENKNTPDHFDLKIGSYDHRLGSILKHFSFGDTLISLDAYYQEGHKGIRTTGRDKSDYNAKYRSNTPGHSYEWLEDYSFGLFMKHGGLRLKARLKESKEGSAFGGAGYMPDNKDPEGIGNRSYFIHVGYENEPIPNLHYSVKGEITGYKQDAEVYLYPLANGDNVLYDFGTDEVARNLEATINWRGFESHDIIVGTQYLHAEGTDSEYFQTYESTGEYYLTPRSLIPEDVDRKIQSFYLQDVWSLNHAFDLSVGARYDDYSDFDAHLSPRIAAVWKIDAHNNLKAMVGKAYRIPTFVELHGTSPASYANNDLEPEHIESYELAYIHKQDMDNVLRTNIYHTITSDIIYKNSSNQYVQNGENKAYGLEIEYKRKLAPGHQMTFNFSTLRYEDEFKNDHEGVANNLANFWYQGALNSQWKLSTVMQYVDAKPREEGVDSRPSTDSYTRIDQTVTYGINPHTTLNVSVKNLLNAPIRYPDLYFKDSSGGYYNDFPREGRTLWVKLTMDF